MRLNKYEEKFKAGTNGMHNLEYEDMSCLISLPTADVRDEVLWVSIEKVLDKRQDLETKLSKTQRYEVIKRVSAAMRFAKGVEGKVTIYANSIIENSVFNKISIVTLLENDKVILNIVDNK
ncbi:MULTISPECIES: hypothetical protein [Clostridium]|uniref:YolD-like protein n=1 Tax=Clostridium frigoriphilum TaxID=443253 RepID=A0ABU7UVK5_9CLOT|nr:hypothetical protein [Clostridium sp. DSM 17811]MBU3102411.1 hypothetical protein [Clostridium sp. DSM 17811]